MKILKEISLDKVSAEAASTFEVRRAVRAILKDENGNLAILFVRKHKYHKLPGGGLEEGEGWQAALARECREETGCEIKTLGEVGRVVEYRGKFRLKQISDCYKAVVAGEKGKPAFTDDEVENMFELIWVPAGEAVQLFESDNPDDYEGKFIRERDLAFIRRAAGAA